MDCLFDRIKEHWAVWNGLYDVERSQRRNNLSLRLAPPEPAPLYYATLYGLRDLAERLIAAYMQDIKTRGGYYKTPLHAALAKELPDFALFLLGCGSDVDVDPLHRDSPTALYKASSRGDTNVVRSLVDRGAKAEGDDWNEKGDDVWRTLLFVASGNGRMEVVLLTLEHHANVNYQDNDGKGTLHLASRHPSSDVARLLPDRGANINACSTRGKTALNEASEFGQIAAVELLLERGVNVARSVRFPHPYLGRVPHSQCRCHPVHPPPDALRAYRWLAPRAHACSSSPSDSCKK